MLLLVLMLPAAAIAAEPGDEPATAIPVSAGEAMYDSTEMTSNAAVDPASCGEFEGFSNTMWFSYTPAKSGLTIVDINSFVSEDGSTDFLAIAFVYRVASNGSLTLVGCSAYPATVVFRASAGTTYLIVSAALDAEDTGEPECRTTVAPSTSRSFRSAGGSYSRSLRRHLRRRVLERGVRHRGHGLVR